ncbi:MAG: hypothetical protein KC800_30550, partial [Candidatus Eremiobacteraeota bacterium]|nr:hypothetical protein [Candidatus Eremiobacteraeota bacterium]
GSKRAKVFIPSEFAGGMTRKKLFLSTVFKDFDDWTKREAAKVLDRFSLWDTNILHPANRTMSLSLRWTRDSGHLSIYIKKEKGEDGYRFLYCSGVKCYRSKFNLEDIASGFIQQVIREGAFSVNETLPLSELSRRWMKREIFNRTVSKK